MSPAKPAPAMPYQMTRPDAQQNFEYLNFRIWELEQELTVLEGKFPQLAVAGVHKDAFGNAEAEWPGSANASSYVEVTHGLGSEAKEVVFGVKVNGVGCFPEWENVSATKFKVRLQAPFGQPGAGTKAAFSWRALS